MQAVLEAPVSQQLEQAVKKPGYVKVRLFYSSETPASSLHPSLRAHTHAKVDAPWPESTVILIHAEKAFSILQAYQDAFENLKDHGAIPPSSRLSDFQLLPHDDRTLAHVIQA